MADVFISYSSEDRDRAHSIRERLRSRGWSAWWDQDNLPGAPKYSTNGAELESATCVVVCWSPAALNSRWVPGEAEKALSTGRYIPIILAPTKLMAPFASEIYCDLTNWDGQPDSSQLDSLVDAIARRLTDDTPDNITSPPIINHPEAHTPQDSRFALGIREFQSGAISSAVTPASLQVLATHLSARRKDGFLITEFSSSKAAYRTIDDLDGLLSSDEAGPHAIPALQIALMSRKDTPQDRSQHALAIEQVTSRCPPGHALVTESVYRESPPIQRYAYRAGQAVTVFGRTLGTYVSRSPVFEVPGTSRAPENGRVPTLPLIPHQTWDVIRPPEDLSLRSLGSIMRENVTLIMGESRKPNTDLKPVMSPAATSDAVGAVELISAINAQNVRGAIDEWEDTIDYAFRSDIVVVGSGIVNKYAYAFNDLFHPVRFEKAGVRITDLIHTHDNSIFGRHTPNHRAHTGLIAVSRNPFNPNHRMLWVAGITGMATQAAARFAVSLLTSKTTAIGDGSIRNPIACIVTPSVPSDSSIEEYQGRWRIEEAHVLWATDLNGATWMRNSNSL